MRLLIFSVVINASVIIGCSTNGQNLRQSKLDCYLEKLELLQKDTLYMNIRYQFYDTLTEMSKDKRNFGDPKIVTKQLDSAIFYNQNKTGCLLIMLQRNNFNLVFGTAKIVKGVLKNDKWVFSTNMDYSYSKSFYKLYSENSLENISKLARFSVLTTGVFKEKGCDIDEDYWFKELKN